jgi:hypothetical protein
MSVKALTYVLEHSTHKGNELLTLVVLADHADENGICWPSMERVGRLIRADERTARRCVRRLEKSGELRIERGGGRSSANRYQIAMQRTLELFQEKGGNLPPDNLPPIKTRTNRPLNPDTAVSPEPSRTKDLKGVAGQGKPSPVAHLFKDYHDGIARLYGAEYPRSAKANGQLALVLKLLGAERAGQALAYYLGSAKPYYATRKHALDVFVRDAADLCVAMQQAAGGPRAAAPTRAGAYLEIEGEDAPVRMADYPLGEPLDIAKQFAREFASRVNRPGVRVVMIRIGARETRFKQEELR